MKKFGVGTICIIGFFFVLLATLPQYGINEDSPFHFLRGQAYLTRLTTGVSDIVQPQLTSPVLFRPEQRISTYKYNTWELNVAPLRPIANADGETTVQGRFEKYTSEAGRVSFYRHNAWNADVYQTPGHPPVSDILEAMSNRIFYEKLGLLGDIEAYHVYVTITAAVAVLGVYYIGLVGFGSVAGVFAAITLALYPVFFAESHFNIKDIPELACITISIISFYFWVTTRKIDWFITLCLSFFIGVGTKLNILFLPFILAPWLITMRKTETFRQWWLTKPLLLLATLGAGAFISLLLVWPYTWDAPITRILDVITAYVAEGVTDPILQVASPFLLPGGIDYGPILLLLAQTPLISLLFFIVGVIVLVLARVKKQRYPHNMDVLIFVWFSIPLLRVVRPGADTFQAMRTYMEFLPALALVAGVGGAACIRAIQNHWKSKAKRSTSYIFGLCYVLALVTVLVRFHPNENVYFNALVGGPKGAWQKGLYTWRTSYHNPYRQAINWLNIHAKEGAHLAYLDGTMQSIPSIWLRPDIALGSYFSGFEKKGEYIISLVFPKPPSVFGYLYMKRFLKPVYEVTAGGIPLVSVYKNDIEHSNIDWRDMVQLAEIPDQRRANDSTLGQYWQIDLESNQRVASVTITMPTQNCNAKDGLFALNTYIVPWRIDTNEHEATFYFPGELTRVIRFYGLDAQSCLLLGTIKQIEVLGKK